MRAKNILIFIVLIFSSSGIFAQHENQSYLPLTQAEMKNKFPIKYIGTFGDERPPYFEVMQDIPLSKNLNAGVSEINVSQTENELTISGKDKKQKNWSVKLEYFSRNSVRFYVSDLDKNGIRDLILLIPTGGNGLAPTSHFFSLIFDSAGRPIPFRADGYFEDKRGQIFDLVDIDRDGRAELLYMNFDDGYWITNFYKIQNARWQRVKGKLGNRSYPLHTRFTYRESHKAITPKKGRNPFAPDLSNVASKMKGKLVSYDWANTNQSEDISLNIIDRSGKKISASPISWYSSFFAVIDTKDERKIVSLSAPEESMKAVLDEIIAKKYAIEIYGQRSFAKVSPELLWAKGL
jgi:hypothetical protein